MLRRISPFAVGLVLLAIAPPLAHARRGHTAARRPTLHITIVRGETKVLCAFGQGSCGVQSSEALCPGGWLATGGGWDGAENPVTDQDVTYNGPAAGDRGWAVIAANLGPEPGNLQALAVCERLY